MRGTAQSVQLFFIVLHGFLIVIVIFVAAVVVFFVALHTAKLVRFGVSSTGGTRTCFESVNSPDIFGVLKYLCG